MSTLKSHCSKYFPLSTPSIKLAKMGRYPRYRWAKVALSILLLGPDFAIGTKRIRKSNDPAARRFRLRNLSASGVELYWVNMVTEERRLQFELLAGASDTLNSHIYHEFEIREQPSKKGGKCKGTISSQQFACICKRLSLTWLQPLFWLKARRESAANDTFK